MPTHLPPASLPIYGRLRARAGSAPATAQSAAFAMPLLQESGHPLPAFFLAQRLEGKLPRADTFAGRSDTLWQRSSFRPEKSAAVPVWRRGYKDGRAHTALFNQPTGMAVDTRGNLFVADSLNHCIRRIGPGGQVKTWVGNGTCGHHDGRGSKARLNRPTGMVSGPNNGLLVVDQGNQTLRFIDKYRELITLPLQAQPLGGIAYESSYAYLTVKINHHTALLRIHLDTQENALLTHWEGRLQWIPYREGDASRPFSRWWDQRENHPVPYTVSHQPLEGLGLAISPSQELVWAEGLKIQRLHLEKNHLQTQRFDLPIWPAPRWQGIAVQADHSVYLLDAEHQHIYHVDKHSHLRLAAEFPHGLAQPYALAQNAYGQVFVSDTGHWRICRLNLPGNGPLVRLAQLAFLPYLPHLQEPAVLELKKGVYALMKRYLYSPKSADTPLAGQRSSVSGSAKPTAGIAQQYVLDVLQQGQQTQQLNCVKELTEALAVPHPEATERLAHVRPLFVAMLNHEDVAIRTLLVQKLGDTIHTEQDALFWISLFEGATETNRLLKKYRLEILSFLGRQFQLYGHVVPLMVKYVAAEEEDVVEHAFAQLMKVREAGYDSLVDPLMESLRQAP